jgi:sec-independent protein translocase protein TatA
MYDDCVFETDKEDFMMSLLAFHVPFMDQSFVLLVIGLLLFGKRLPEVGKSLGQGIVQFKKGLKGIEDEVEQAVNTPTTPALPRPVTTAVSPEQYKFDPVTGKPIEPTATIPPGAKFDPYTGKPIEPKSSDPVGAA